MHASPPKQELPQGASLPAKPYIGGQAVLEGVMMRSPQSFAIVVRKADGSLAVRERGISDPRQGYEKWPFVRGIMALVESLKIGNEALRFSVEEMEKDMEAAERLAKYSKPNTLFFGALGAPKLLRMFRTFWMQFNYSLSHLMLRSDAEGGGASHNSSGASKSQGGGFGLMMLMMVVFMVALPQVAAGTVNSVFHMNLELQSPKFQALTGAFKIFIVVGYMLVLRNVKDIRRVFQYHGAEHKTISTYEAGEELTVSNARTKTTLHPRCGTTFLVMIALVSVAVFTVLGTVLPKIDLGNKLLNNIAFFLIKVPFVPFIASLTFEIQRIFAKYFTKGPLRIVLWPGFLVQKITTIEPDDMQLEVALASLRVTLFREEGATAKADTTLARFDSYEALQSADALSSS